MLINLVNSLIEKILIILTLKNLMVINIYGAVRGMAVNVKAVKLVFMIKVINLLNNICSHN